MTVDSRPLGRRERNKLDKLERITTAAGELFAERGVDDVTTQEIADRADIGTGTLFLYAKTKGELLLLVQNSMYAEALERGRAAAADADGVLEGVLAVIRPVIECNRTQIDNGRTYLREIVFGDPEEPHHGEALALTGQTEQLVADVIARDTRVSADEAAALARIVSAVMFLTMSATINIARSVEQIVDEVAAQIRVILPA
ncbi:helix-turn-helix domain-containing protein [Microbacterium sp. CFBP9023]|uniref:TetR/AcrR family transcriptional regulator n=1 Tax=Microbacterium sp. CFBP9023 TaxID=3096535 RepID=UPI002A69A938|nr:helix-turn-helix domain-containing protein [Microbacterium sp. CFBP9023]MDY0984959.1 helix-turn-helix domain-containing protein [Microbacterium sp. CFBP9023]